MTVAIVRTHARPQHASSSRTASARPRFTSRTASSSASSTYASEDPTGAELFDAGDLVVSPGLVDTHVHINEPGRTAWEGLRYGDPRGGGRRRDDARRHAAEQHPGDDDRRRAAGEAARRRGRSVTSTSAFWGGVVPGNAGELDALVDAGVRGFKCFLVPSGVDEFPAVDEDDLREALPVLARRSVPLLVHAESPRARMRIAERIADPRPIAARGRQSARLRDLSRDAARRRPKSRRSG